MELKKLHMGTVVFTWDSMDEVSHLLSQGFGDEGRKCLHLTSLTIRSSTELSRAKRYASRAPRHLNPCEGRCAGTGDLSQCKCSLASCSRIQVTPVTNDDGTVTYQASSPDEVAIVQWTESVGLSLIARDRNSMTLRWKSGETMVFDILSIFPFTSESKRMGIIVRERSSGTTTFVQKGADVVMSNIVQSNDWLDEECGNMAREGLRTLVVGRKRLSENALAEFNKRHRSAQLLGGDERAEAIQRVIDDCLESELELLALTGVEDKLQDDVKSTLELMRNAGLKIWMLTGDKIETATNIAVSSKLVSRNQYIHQVAKRKLDETGI